MIALNVPYVIWAWHTKLDALFEDVGVSMYHQDQFPLMNPSITFLVQRSPEIEDGLESQLLQHWDDLT